MSLSDTQDSQDSLTLVQCPICRDVIINNLQLIPCHHTFCKDCVSQWLGTSLACPVCRSPVTLTQHNAYREVQIKTGSFDCPYRDFGCTFNGMNATQLIDHEDSCSKKPSEHRYTIEEIKDLEKSGNFIQALQSINMMNINETNENKQKAMFIKCNIFKKMGLYEKCIQLLSTHPLISMCDNFDTNFISAECHRKLENFDQAEVSYKKCLQSSTSITNLPMVYRGIALILKKRRAYQDSMANLKLALVICEQNLEIPQCTSIILHCDIADVLRKQGKLSESFAMFQNCVFNHNKHLMMKEIDQGDAWYSQGMTMIEIGHNNFDDPHSKKFHNEFCFQSLNNALKIYEKHQHSQKIALVCFQLGRYYNSISDVALASQNFERGIRLYQQHQPNSLEFYDGIIEYGYFVYNHRNSVSLTNEKRDATIKLLENAKTLFNQKYGSKHDKIATCDTLIFLLKEIPITN